MPTNLKRRVFWPLAGLLMLSTCGCSGGGGAAAAVDLSGYWQLYLTPQGGSESGPAPVCLSQTGNALDGADITGTVLGTTMTLTSSTSMFTITAQGNATASEVTGTLTISGLISATGTFRMEKFAPTGTMTVNGTVGSSTVALNVATAIGGRDYSDPGHTTLSQVELTAAIGSEHCEIDFTPAGLAVGALAVPGDIDATVVYRNDSTDLEVAATGGTVTLSRYDGSGIAGSYVLTLSGGGTVTGTFDVSWDIASYSP